jgi:hypothetical protein
MSRKHLFGHDHDVRRPGVVAAHDARVGDADNRPRAKRFSRPVQERVDDSAVIDPWIAFQVSGELGNAAFDESQARQEGGELRRWRMPVLVCRDL